MGCITAKVTRVGGINASAHSIGGINASTSRVSGIDVTASLICVVNKNTFIKVTPIETQWIDVDLSVNYNIKSNTNWNII